ncbi:MAG TPA: GntG family PLP-dependent aldolase, partial [Candidatus Thermoplasmatota archaeon]|nr:GntG family PLP-dependent aldolase [Candidatus Thermoplasmatota archaeon]
LETAAARATGKEAALFCASGTMANQVALAAHCVGVIAPEVVLEQRSHIFLNEAAGLALVARAQARVLGSDRGALRPADVAAAIHAPGNVLRATTALVCTEDTHNYWSGRAIPVRDLEAVRVAAHERRVPVHLDGARIFNAAVALACDARDLAATADTVQFCFSKGLGAPMGSIVCGSSAFRASARRLRQALGGGLRQAGVVAAPALLALEHNVKRLADDHANAALLASALRDAGVDAPVPDTNIVIFDVAPLGVAPDRFAALAKERGVGVSVVSGREVRLVTHLDAPRALCERAAEALADVVRGLRAHG